MEIQGKKVTFCYPRDEPITSLYVYMRTGTQSAYSWRNVSKDDRFAVGSFEYRVQTKLLIETERKEAETLIKDATGIDTSDVSLGGLANSLCNVMSAVHAFAAIKSCPLPNVNIVHSTKSILIYGGEFEGHVAVRGEPPMWVGFLRMIDKRNKFIPKRRTTWEHLLENDD